MEFARNETVDERCWTRGACPPTDSRSSGSHRQKKL